MGVLRVFLSVMSIRWRCLDHGCRAAQERQTGTTWIRPGSGKDGRDKAGLEAGSLDWALGSSYSCKQEQEQAGGREVSVCRVVRAPGFSGALRSSAEGVFPWAVSSGGVFRFQEHPLLSDDRGLLFL